MLSRWGWQWKTASERAPVMCAGNSLQKKITSITNHKTTERIIEIIKIPCHLETKFSENQTAVLGALNCSNIQTNMLKWRGHGFNTHYTPSPGEAQKEDLHWQLIPPDWANPHWGQSAFIVSQETSWLPSISLSPCSLRRGKNKQTNTPGSLANDSEVVLLWRHEVIKWGWHWG